MSKIDRTIAIVLVALFAGLSPACAEDALRLLGEGEWERGGAFADADVSFAGDTLVRDAGNLNETITLTNGDTTPVYVPPAIDDSRPREQNPFVSGLDDVPPVIGPAHTSGPASNMTAAQPNQWRFLPSDTMFRSFIAGVHAPRMGGEIVTDSDQGTLLDVTIGSRISLLRYGTFAPDSKFGSEGVELQLYGAALTRLAMDRASDVEATDYKFGVPLVFRSGSTAHQIGYDHLSSHIGDEYLVRHPNFQRRNYVRDAIRYAIIQDVTEDLSVYADVNAAFHTSGGAGRWHFQFGAEYEPYVPGGFRGAPVAAINTQLREEFDYEGSLGLVLGWQWRGMTSDDLLRLGLSVYSGHSRQYSFYEKYENLVGVGLWYDF